MENGMKIYLTLIISLFIGFRVDVVGAEYYRTDQIVSLGKVEKLQEIWHAGVVSDNDIVLKRKPMKLLFWTISSQNPKQIEFIDDLQLTKMEKIELICDGNQSYGLLLQTNDGRINGNVSIWSFNDNEKKFKRLLPGEGFESVSSREAYKYLKNINNKSAFIKVSPIFKNAKEPLGANRNRAHNFNVYIYIFKNCDGSPDVISYKTYKEYIVDIDEPSWDAGIVIDKEINNIKKRIKLYGRITSG